MLSSRDFPGGPVGGSLPANAEDTGWIPGPGKSHMPQSNKAHEPQLLIAHSRPHEPQLLSPLESMLCNKRSHHNEKSMHRNKEKPPFTTTGESPLAATKTQRSHK